MTLCSTWITEAELIECGECDAGSLPALRVAEIVNAASDLLYRLSGRQWPGVCEDVIRPCRCSSCSLDPWYSLASSIPWAVRDNGAWINVTCGCGGGEPCGCGGDALALPYYPVISVIEVLIDGAVFSAWRLDRGGILQRTDGGSWPCCQDRSLAITEDGTWQVTYEFGADPPQSAKEAARALAIETVKACTSDKTCRLPRGTTSVTRRGVSYSIESINLISGLRQTQTGLPEVDLWLASVNPDGLRSRARVLSPDDAQFVRPTVVGS